MSYLNRPIRGKRTMFVLCFGLAFSMTNAQQSQTFNYTGSMTSWTVPSCVTQVTVDMAGAQGGSGGGDGGRVQCVYSTSQSTVLNIFVGGQGAADASAAAGGYNGGGNAGTSNGGSYGSGGGGASDIRVGGVALANRVIVAGGGGGINTDNNSPGIGGGLSGGNSNGCCNTCFTSWSKGGTQAAGGNDAVGSGSCCTFTPTPNGSLGVGANGAGPSNSCNNGDGGGGGGGGYYGGGGGGGYGSGAGGSSYTNASCSGVTHTQGYQSGNGYIKLTWTTSASIATGHIINNVSCYGGNNGKASAIVNGLPPYVYSWTPGGQTTDTINGLSAGIYTVTVSGSCGGTASASVTITQPATAVSVSAGTITNILCNGGNNGSVSSFTSGGTSPYTYLWTPAGGTAHTANGLTAGTYTMTATDNHGCTASASTTVTQPNALLVSANVSASVQCNGGANGSASSSVTFGTTPYTYVWSNAETTSAISGLTAGTFSLNVTDNNGCTGSAVVTITQPATFMASASVVSNVLCYGGNNGSASSNVSGGASPYNYFWSDGETNANAAALSAGTYTVVATDNCGSSATVLVTVTQPAALGGTATVVENVNCNGASNGCASVSTSGGTPPYAYQWSDVNNQITPTACGLSAGTYTVSITDNNGCKGAVSATITQPSSISVSATSSIDRGNCTGGASVSVSGGVAPYSYAWANGNTTNSISGQCGDATYCCTVTDAMGCQQNACVTIKKLSTGIANVNGGTEGITVYPNPNNGQFTIESSVTGGQWSVEVYNVLGEKVYSTFNIQNPTLDINLSNQPNGVYLYRVVSEDGSLLGEGKIMLQK